MAALNRYHRGMRRHNRHKGAPIKRQPSSLPFTHPSYPSSAHTTLFPDAGHKREQTLARISRLNGSLVVRRGATASRRIAGLPSRSLSFLLVSLPLSLSLTLSFSLSRRISRSSRTTANNRRASRIEPNRIETRFSSRRISNERYLSTYSLAPNR